MSSSVPSPAVFEGLGKFYLGRLYDLANRSKQDEPLVYDSRHLTTHALCVGMTGSGKTGLCLSLLEEAALDGVPVIAIDPKGDLGNLLLTFPDLSPASFARWSDPGEARSAGVSQDELGERYARLWQNGLAADGIDPARMLRFQESVDVRVYTPGSQIGLPMTVVQDLSPPPAGEGGLDPEAIREKVTAAVSGLLGLLGIDSDPLTGREHILLSSIIAAAWEGGETVSLSSLVRLVQSPPIKRIGVMDVDQFYPPAERGKLAMTLNGLLASPAFTSWLEGEPLDIDRLLFREGKPQISILSIAHLDEAQRMFFVTLLLSELVAWMRTQSGTNSLRAIVYMDEIYGYFPPSAKPPSKPPMLTLLKQARAFGLGVVLATQNPVDLDYKGLSNIGTWFLGRLQTDRDKQRVLDGLEGAAATWSAAWDRSSMEQTLAALGSRVFLMHCVHDDAPEIFHSRWAMSFLRGPLSRQQISELMTRWKDVSTRSATKAAPTIPPEPINSSSMLQPEVGTASLPPDVTQRYLRAEKLAAPGADVFYQPALMLTSQVHFVLSGCVDAWQNLTFATFLPNATDDLSWQDAWRLDLAKVTVSDEAEGNLPAEPLPAACSSDRVYSRWRERLREHIYKNVTATVFYSPDLQRCGPLNATETDTRIALRQFIREARDAAVDAVQKDYESGLTRLRRQRDEAHRRLLKEQSEAQSSTLSSALDIGGSLLGSLFGSGRRKLSPSATGRSAGKIVRERADVRVASEQLDTLQNELTALEQRCEEEATAIRQRFQAEMISLEQRRVSARKGDMTFGPFTILWIPCERSDGAVRPLVGLH